MNSLCDSEALEEVSIVILTLIPYESLGCIQQFSTGEWRSHSLKMFTVFSCFLTILIHHMENTACFTLFSPLHPFNPLHPLHLLHLLPPNSLTLSSSYNLSQVYLLVCLFRSWYSVCTPAAAYLMIVLMEDD